MPSKYSKPEELNYKQLKQRIAGKEQYYKEQGWNIQAPTLQTDINYFIEHEDRLWQEYLDSINQKYPVNLKCRHCLIEYTCAHRALGLSKGQWLNDEDISDLTMLHIEFFRHNACSPVCLSHVIDKTDTTTKLEQSVKDNCPDPKHDYNFAKGHDDRCPSCNSEVGEEHQATLRAYDAKYGRF